MFNLTRRTVWERRKIEKWSETWPNNFKPLSGRLVIFHWHFLKVFHHPKFAQKRCFFTARLCRGSHANISQRLGEILVIWASAISRFGALSIYASATGWIRFWRLRFRTPTSVSFWPSLQGRKRYTPPWKTTFFSFSGSKASLVYTLLSGPMVHTLFPCFPKGVVYTIAFFFSVTSGSGNRPRQEGCHSGGVYRFSLHWARGRTRWVPLSLLYLCAKQTPRVSRRTQRVWRRSLWVLSLKQHYSARFLMYQIPREGGFSKGGFCRIQRPTQNEIPKDLDPAVHLALSEPLPKGANFCKENHETKTREAFLT